MRAADMVYINPVIITLAINGSNVPTERQTDSESKHMTQLCYLQETYFVTLEMDRKIYHANTRQRRAGVDVLVSDTETSKERY